MDRFAQHFSLIFDFSDRVESEFCTTGQKKKKTPVEKRSGSTVIESVELERSGLGEVEYKGLVWVVNGEI